MYEGLPLESRIAMLEVQSLLHTELMVGVWAHLTSLNTDNPIAAAKALGESCIAQAENLKGIPEASKHLLVQEHQNFWAQVMNLHASRA